MESAITIKGQAIMPKPIREHLGLQPGDRVKFFVHPDGSVVLLPQLPASALRGALKSRSRQPVTTEQMNIAAAEGALSRNSRRRHRCTNILIRYLTQDDPVLAELGARAGCTRTLTFDQKAIRLIPAKMPSFLTTSPI